MRKMMIQKFLMGGAAALLMSLSLQVHSASLSPAPGGDVTTNFTCNSKSGVCKCEGKQDCFDLGSSGLCEPNSTMDGNLPNTLMCRFKFRRQTAPIQE